MKTYNWQHSDWPNFTYDESGFRDVLYQYALEAGRLSCGVGQLQEDLQYEATIDLMVSEAVKTSMIEGENLNRDDVRSSIKNYLGLSEPYTRISDPRVEGVAALMIDVRKGFSEELTKEKLFQWHEMVLPHQDDRLFKVELNVGKFRDAEEPMQIVSGPIGYQKVHYEAPPSHQVDAEMDQFLSWYNETNPVNADAQRIIPGPVRSAIAHLWFESIHPFDDGNGRVGRAIAEQALAQDLGRPPLLSLSTAIESNKNVYYDGLHEASKANMDITPWVEMFCRTILKAQKNAVAAIDFILSKSKFWAEHGEDKFNVRQLKAVKKIFAAGEQGWEYGISAKKYGALTGCSKATATRDLADLLKKGCITSLPGGGRNARYALNLGERKVSASHSVAHKVLGGESESLTEKLDSDDVDLEMDDSQ